MVRLDFNESPRVDVTANMRFASDTSAVSNEKEETAVEQADDDCGAQRENSDDERKNDKLEIERLVKEVENLVGEERHAGASRTFPPLVFEEKNITNNHRVKYARVKEWLKLNATRSHEGRSQVSRVNTLPTRPLADDVHDDALTTGSLEHGSRFLCVRMCSLSFVKCGGLREDLCCIMSTGTA